MKQYKTVILPKEMTDLDRTFNDYTRTGWSVHTLTKNFEGDWFILLERKQKPISSNGLEQYNKVKKWIK